jgi:magnesium-transporting ATPase (P-type)
MNVFVAIEIAYLLNCRSLDAGFRTGGVFSNPWVWLGMAAMLALQLVVTYLPAANRVFATAPIDAVAWLQIAAVTALAALAVVLEKRWTHRARRGAG